MLLALESTPGIAVRRQWMLAALQIKEQGGLMSLITLGTKWPTQPDVPSNLIPDLVSVDAVWCAMAELAELPDKKYSPYIYRPQAALRTVIHQIEF
jgi:hypothetical protein